jgi:hypothetical protein
LQFFLQDIFYLHTFSVGIAKVRRGYHKSLF